MSEARDAIDVGLGLHAQCDDLIAANINRAEQAEARVAELAAGIRRIVLSIRRGQSLYWTRYALESLLTPVLPGMSEHPHTAAGGSEIRHGHVDGDTIHWHAGPPYKAAILHRQYREGDTSIYYPDIDGKPDPRSRDPKAEAEIKLLETLFDKRHKLWRDAEALLDECLGLLVTMPTPSSTSEQQYEWAERYRAFRDRPEVKARLSAVEDEYCHACAHDPEQCCCDEDD